MVSREREKKIIKNNHFVSAAILSQVCNTTARRQGIYIYINNRPFVSSEDEIYRRFQYWFLAAPYPFIRLYSSPVYMYIILLLYYYNDWWAGGWLGGWGSHKSTFTVLSATVFEYASIISSSFLISILCFFS